MKKLLFTAVVTALSFALPAQDYQKYGVDISVNKPTGIKKGDVVQAGLEATDQNGTTLKLDELVKQGKVIVQFYRGNWCPVCNKYYEKNAAAFEKIEKNKSAKVIIVSPEPMAEIKKMFENKKINLSVVSDKEGKWMDLFDVKYKVNQDTKDKLKKYLSLSLKKHNTAKNKEFLPVPATFVLDQDRKVIFKQFDVNYKNRASLDQINKAI